MIYNCSTNTSVWRQGKNAGHGRSPDLSWLNQNHYFQQNLRVTREGATGPKRLRLHERMVMRLLIIYARKGERVLQRDPVLCCLGSAMLIIVGICARVVLAQPIDQITIQSVADVETIRDALIRSVWGTTPWATM